jgi:ubiquinone/menaquinone biosynthesis C-methylase UbiE
MKDNFSINSENYAKYRPTYPAEFFDYLNTILPNKQKAWDCGTGNGQIAYELAKTFDYIFATDISQSQIDNALLLDNISYSVQPAEKTTFESNLFDLIIIGQAIHWFNFDEFYKEVNRTANNNAIICVVGYSRVKISEEIDKLITAFYKDIIGPYWDDERKYIDENYATIPFPFLEIQTPKFNNIQHWTLNHLIGYLNTWSAVKHFIKYNNYNPINDLQREIEKLWDNNSVKEVCFPLLLRIGKILK